MGARRRYGLGVLLAGAISTACAAIMSVEEATLRDPNETTIEAGAVDPSSTGTESADPDAGCVGAGCPCSTDDHCLDWTFSKCVAGACVECTTVPEDSCPDGRHCNEKNECAIGCKSDRECELLSPFARFCNLTRHQCVACRDDTDCNQAENQGCTLSGVCADRCTPDAGPDACLEGKQCCGGLCVDVQSDIFNCNGCGNTCSGGSPLCCAGTCADGNTDVKNCGQCGFACSTTNGTPSCSSGACRWTCKKGFSHCTQDNTGCETNTSNNVLQCGTCVTSCTGIVVNASGVACKDSKCTYDQCANGFGDCDGQKQNGCECACGKRGERCCPKGRCLEPGDTCGPDDKCRACQGKDAACNRNDQCCSNRCDRNKCK